MKILAIETSCDDTGCAILEVIKKNPPRFKILSNIVSSQVKIHQKYGGVYPFLAKREHIKNLPLVFKKALAKAKNPKIDFIAVTQGPGLEPCLWTGINFAKETAKKLKLDLIPVNHVMAHIFANWLEGKIKNVFPALCLIVSGGHTQLILMKDCQSFKVLGQTRDDAAGECLDKTARILGLGYPGGPIIAKLAKSFKGKKSISLPRPMISQKNYDFSFSGLKTAVLYKVQELTENNKKLNSEQKKEIAKEAQQAIIDVLLKKTLKAAKDHKVKSVILSGGVAANEELRRQLKKRTEREGFVFLVPDKKYCTDNAAMIAVAAYFKTKKKQKLEEIIAQANLKIS